MNGYQLDGTDNKRIREFIFNQENEHNCHACPYEWAYGKQTQRLPCGQFRCWVTMSVERK